MIDSSRTVASLALGVALLLVSGCTGLARKAPSAEAVVAARFESVRNDPERLDEFLAEMPLGGDLHHHVGGAATPEMMIRFSAESNLCLPRDPAAIWAATPPPCDASERPIAEALNDESLHLEIERRWSMLDYASYDPAIVRTEANAHFFSIFGKIRLTTRDLGRLLAAVRSDAASEGTLYLETSTGWPGFQAIAGWSNIAWNDDLIAMRRELLSDGQFVATRDSIAAGLSEQLARSEELMGCAGPEPDQGCEVEVRFQRIAVRTLEPVQVFLQVLMGFEVAQTSPLVVAVNLVAPETDTVSLRDYELHMRMFGELSNFYPDVKVTLHSGEMTNAQAVELGARDHLPLAIADPREGGAGASRVGHAVALDASNGREEILERMKREKIAVEINLRSNELLLGVRGAAHPLLDYFEAGVPIVLATDDPGLMGTGLREQYQLAAAYEELSYLDLKQFVRNSVEYSFMEPGARARLQDRLEGEFAAFESGRARAASQGGEEPD
jgi:adenosine deaminase